MPPRHSHAAFRHIAADTLRRHYAIAAITPLFSRFADALIFAMP